LYNKNGKSIFFESVTEIHKICHQLQDPKSFK